MTDPSKPARQVLHVSLTVKGIEQLDELATAEDRSRSQMVRVLLREAVAARKRRATP